MGALLVIIIFFIWSALLSLGCFCILRFEDVCVGGDVVR